MFLSKASPVAAATEPLKWTILSLSFVIVLTTAIRLPLLAIPFERDEGEYAYIAWRLGAHELPYREWIDQKPPGIFWAYRAALAFPLEPVRAAHALALIVSAASACALFFLARRFMGIFWACAAAALFAVLSADPWIEGASANTEIFMLLPLILSLPAFLRAEPEGRRGKAFMLLCGALVGAAALFKQVAAVNWPFLVALYPIYVARGKRLRHTFSFAAWSAAGSAAIWLPVLAYFFLRGALGDFIANVFTHNLEYVNAVPWSSRWDNCAQTMETLSRAQATAYLFAFAGFWALLRAGRGRLFLLLAGWLAASFLATSASGYFFPHYFQQLLPSLALAAALGAEALCLARLPRAVAPAARKALAVLLLAAPPAFAFYPFFFKMTPADAVTKIYPGNFFAEMPALAQRLAEVTRPDARVFVFGAEAELLFYARRVSATRYIFLFPLYGPYSSARKNQLAAAEEITAARPAAALLLPNGLFFGRGTDQYFTRWTQFYFHEFFQEDMRLLFDRLGAPSLLREAGSPLPDGAQQVGALLVRKAR